MKSKSPFAIKSPLLAYKSDMTGNYANPEYVPRVNVGAAVGAHAAKTAADVFTTVNEADKGKRKAAADKASGGSNTNNQTFNLQIGGEQPQVTKDTNSNRRTEVLEEQGSGGFSGQSAQDLLGRNLTTEESAWKDAEIKKLGGVQQYRDHYKIGKEKDKFHTETTNKYENERLTSSVVKDLLKNPISMKGSPVKHNAGAAGAIGSDFSQAKNQYADIFGKSATTVGQNKQSGVGALQSFITRAKNQGGSMVGSVGQQIGNQAQQIAADAGGSTGVDPFLPPPNQVAETGSYGGGGDRILEMDSNPVGNQSIGRDTDVASQLFGSGQRASMLAMKGTPLHTEGHGGAEGHTHAKPGDFLDQTVAENMGVNDIENYKPIQKFKGKQIVVNPSTNDSIFSTNSTFVIPKQMEGITLSPEGTPKYKPVYINKKSN